MKGYAYNKVAEAVPTVPMPGSTSPSARDPQLDNNAGDIQAGNSATNAEDNADLLEAVIKELEEVSKTEWTD